MDKKQYLSGLYPSEVSDLMRELNQPAFRAKQALEWMYKKAVIQAENMKNLPAELKQILKAVHPVCSLYQELKFTSKSDKTAKYALITDDKQVVETVFIPTSKRATVCLSTQVGCAYRCMFCASGEKGLKRNLRVDEIISQLEGTPYAEVLSEVSTSFKDTNSLYQIEKRLDDYFEKTAKQLSITNGLGIGPALYMLAGKEADARKIRMLASMCTRGINLETGGAA